MANDSDSSQRPVTIGIECECLEGLTWGMGRQVRKLLEGLVARGDLQGRFRFILYSNNPLPDDPLYDHELFVRRPCGMKPVFGSWAPSSFSLHYYVLLPIRAFWDSLTDGLRGLYYPNYMLPIIHPPNVASLVMLTDDILREAYNPALSFRYRIAYLIFSLFWAKRFATRLMAISRSSVPTLRAAGIAPERIVVNELGVQDPLPASVQAPAADFLFIGQAFPRRRLKESLLAFERIAREKPDLTFRFIGTDKYQEPTIGPLMERVNRDLGRKAVSHVTFVSGEGLAAAYRSARTLLYVSDTEGFGLPPLEALSYDTPPIVADTPLNREIYQGNAFLVPEPFAIDDIEATMRRAVDDAEERERILSAGPSVVGRYTWQAHADRFVDIMSTITT